MLIFVIDDERPLLEEARRTVAEAAPDAEILAFSRGDAALNAIAEQGLSPGIAFCDIEMPGISGLEFAVKLKTASPETRVVFVTGYPQYALDAFGVHAQGYVLKPLRAEQVREELTLLPVPPAPEPADKLRVRCFGNFEVFWHGEPLLFERTKSKELLAYLVDREGAVCTAEEVISALWEKETDMKAAKNRLRVILSDLRTALRRIGMEDVLIRQRRQVAVRCERLDCDYYRMRTGDPAAVNEFRGTYMEQYSWAELTSARLFFQSES